MAQLAPNYSDQLFYAIIGLCTIGIISSAPYRKLSYKKVTVVATSILVIVAISVLNVVAARAVPVSDAGNYSKFVNGQQVVNSTLLSGQYPHITVQVGTPVKWVISASDESINGCNNRINIQEYGIINYTFKPGENVIEFTPSKTGNFQYSCWMGMIQGSITVTEAGEQVNSLQSPKAEQNTVQADEDTSSQSTEATIKDGTQYVSSVLTRSGYEPIRVQQGIPVIWTLNVPSGSLNGCNNAIVIPEYDLQINLTNGANKIEFTPDRSGTFVFSCWMGMVRSSITVVGADGQVDNSTDDGSSQLPSCCG